MMDRVEEQVKLLKKAVVDLLLSHLELQQQRLEGHKVCLNVYDLSQGMARQLSMTFLGKVIEGICHSMPGMKVYSTEEKELIMEPTLKRAGNPNILVAAKAFGLKATVQVVNLQVFASPRITLKPLVPSFPYFAKILVSLMEKPHVDFGLKLLGADAMSIPGLYSFVQGEFGVRVDAVSLVNVLPACGVEKVWRRGKEVHGYAVRSGLSEDVYVGNAIVDMNAKCELMDDVGRFEDALSFFEMIKVEKRFGIDGKWNRKIGEDGFWLRSGDFCSDFS
ncbi:hypothetical protein AgCh_007515 [Apium graveolens]